MAKNLLLSFLFCVPTLLLSAASRETIEMNYPEPANPDDLFGSFKIPEGADAEAYGKKLLDEKVREGQVIETSHLDLDDEDSGKKLYHIDPKERDVTGYSSDPENEPFLERIREAGITLLKAVRAKTNLNGATEQLKKLLDETVYFARQNKSDGVNKWFVDGTFGIRQIIQNLKNPRPKEAYRVRELRAIAAQEATNIDVEMTKERRWVLERYATMLEYLEKALNEIVI